MNSGRLAVPGLAGLIPPFGGQREPTDDEIAQAIRNRLLGMAFDVLRLPAATVTKPEPAETFEQHLNRTYADRLAALQRHSLAIVEAEFNDLNGALASNEDDAADSPLDDGKPLPF